MLLYIMVVMAYGFTSLLFLVEPRANMPTVAHAAWLVISTITTVGFGDVVPSTQSGLVLTSMPASQFQSMTRMHSTRNVLEATFMCELLVA